MSRPGIGAYLGVGIVEHGGGNSYDYETDADGTFIDLYIPMLDDSDNIQSERDIQTFATVSTVQEDVASTVSGTRTVSGSIKLRGTYQSLQDWVTLITGEVVVPAITSNYKIYSVNPLSPSDANHYLTGNTKRHLVIEAFRNSADGNSMYYQGVLITEATISVERGGALEIEIGIIGRKHTIDTASTSTPVFQAEIVKMATGQPCTGGNAALRIDTQNYDGSTAVVYSAQSARLTVSMPHEHNFGLTDSAACEMPTISDLQKVTFEVDVIAPDNDATLAQIIDDPVANRVRLADLQIIDEEFVSPAQPSIFRAFIWNWIPESPIEARVEGPGLLRARLSGSARANSTLGGGAAGRNAFRFVVANHNAISGHYVITPRA